MALTKIICPKCNQIYTATAESKYLRCPFCGAPLFEGEEIDIPDLSMSGEIDSLENALRHGFRLLYFRSYNRLLEFSNKMNELYPNNYWGTLFELIGKTEIDFIFLLPKVDYVLSDEEIKEDARARYYHYARRKYASSTQATFNKIAGYYPDIPSSNKKKWNKARTKYEDNVEQISKYSKVASLIREEYLEKLDEYATNEDQRNITYNIKIWLNQVAHAEVDLYRYNQSIESCVKDDYDKTPNPGNRPVFIGYVTFYLISLLTFVLAMTQIILSILNVDMMNNLIFLYFSASVFFVLILASALILFIKQGFLKKHPILAVASLTILFLISTSGIVTAGFQMRINWFAIFAGSIALVSLFYTSVKLVKYLPRKSSEETIIGNYQKLANNTFVVTYTFEFQPYQGEEPKEILFSEQWINGD